MSAIYQNQSSAAAQLPPTPKARFVYYARKVYNPLGFHKGYNFPLFLFTVGTFMGFSLARFSYLNFTGVFLQSTIPGEQFWYQSGFKRVGIIMHLAAIIPATFLVCFQFVPIIRYKAMIVHRINGYIVILLLLIGNAGAFMITKTAVGGSTMLQAYIGVLGTITTVGTVLAYTNIKALQIDQHRAWMLRTWAWAGSIISLRLIMTAAQTVINNYRYEYYSPIACQVIFYLYGFLAGIPADQNPTSQIYPQCGANPSTSTTVVAVPALPFGVAGPENSAALFHVTFGAAGVIALTTHAILVELYLALTPAESARLRMVSYERQLKAGFKHPEKGALTATRLGDAPPGWNSPSNAQKLPSHNSSEQILDGAQEHHEPSQKVIGPNTV